MNINCSSFEKNGASPILFGQDLPDSMKQMVIYQKKAILWEEIFEQEEVEEGEILEVRNRFSVLEDVQNGEDHVIENQQSEDDHVTKIHNLEPLSPRS